MFVANKSQEFCLFVLKSTELGFRIYDLTFRCGDWVLFLSFQTEDGT